MFLSDNRLLELLHNELSNPSLEKQPSMEHCQLMTSGNVICILCAQILYSHTIYIPQTVEWHQPKGKCCFILGA